jgi:drug/metabolite transporter (DMT)-like permease
MTTNSKPSAKRAGAVDAFAASIMVLLCAIWGLNQVAVKVASFEISPFVQGGLRSLCATGLVMTWCRFRGIKIFQRDGTLNAGLLAGLFFTIEFAFFFEGVPRTTAARAVLFFYTAPLFIAIGAHFFVPNERLKIAQVIGLLVAFSGVAMSFADGLRSAAPVSLLIGDGLCLLAAMFWGATMIVVKASKLVTIPAERTLLYQLAASTMLLPIGLLLGETLPGGLSPISVLSFIYQVLVVASASFLTFFWMLKRYDASRLGSFIFLAPAFGVLFGWLLLGEAVNAGLLVGATLICGGIWLVNRK